MEVFIREKNCATCPFANKEKPNFICGDAIANDIGLKTNSSVCKLSYFANEENCPLKSLDQHDAELKKIIYKEAYEQGKFDTKTDLEYKINLARHDAEVRNKVINELLEWADSKIMDWINSPNYREPHFRGTRIIHYCDLKQKLAELLTPNKKERKRERKMSNFCVNCCKNKSGEEIICLKCHKEVCSIFNNKIAELEKQLAIRDKALELVCNLAIDLDNNNNTFGYSNLDKYFIEQAEKKLKGEK